MSVWPNIRSHLACGKRRAFCMQKVAPLPSGRATSETITSGRMLDDGPVGVGEVGAALDAMAAAGEVADDQFEGRRFVFDDDDRDSHGMRPPSVIFYASVKVDP